MKHDMNIEGTESGRFDHREVEQRVSAFLDDGNKIAKFASDWMPAPYAFRIIKACGGVEVMSPLGKSIVKTIFRTRELCDAVDRSVHHTIWSAVVTSIEEATHPSTRHDRTA